MAAPLQLLLCIHNHQPVGNFDSVLRDAFARCYRPFLDILARHPRVRVTLHHTGPLLDWLAANEPSYLADLRALAERRQVEIMGGGYYEPILSALPSEDAVGQISMMTDFCERTFGATPIGAWLAERVWDGDLPRVLNTAGVQYTLVDDTHFMAAGLLDDPLTGYYTTEKAGLPVGVFPISRGLRYRIPFQPVADVIAYLRRLYAECGPVAVTYGDDGEKFGLWPGTAEWVFGKGWLEQFFTSLEENSAWVEATPVGEAFAARAGRGIVYLPTASYEEMGEWTLPGDAQARAHDVRHKLEAQGELDAARPFLRGGIWPNFFAKYSESDWLHKRMVDVSRRLRAASSLSGAERETATRELYQAQCNCGYWHGLFGGLYYQHLRHATWEHLIRAERAVDAVAGAAVRRADIDCDLEDEVVLASPGAVAAVRPHRSGTLCELDWRGGDTNFLAVLTRRREGYHAKLDASKASVGPEAADAPKSIHDITAVKEEGLAEKLIVDPHDRASFYDHFYDAEVSVDDVRAARARELGDFVGAPYGIAGVDDGPEWARVRCVRRGLVRGRDVEIEKRFSMSLHRPTIEVKVTITNLSDADLPVVYATDIAFTLLAAPADASSRFAEILGARRSLAETLKLDAVSTALVLDADRNVGFRARFGAPLELWQFALETVSQSEAGLERTYQGTVWMPVWRGVLAPRKEQTIVVALDLGNREAIGVGA